MINPIVERILSLRGIDKPDDIEEFLSMSPMLTYDPFLMKDMEPAVKEILSFADSGEKICIYGDYDADGVTSVALLSQVLGYISENVCHYIPSRFEEGYGLNKEAIKSLSEEGVKLIITVDCGCVSFEEVEYAKSLNLHMIVTDHHSIDGRAPDCILINPKQDSCNYPYSMLCGCGVAFKLAQAVQRTAQLPKRVLNEVLDLVAIATVGDIVPLLDENRTLVKIGMKRILANKRPGLAELMRAAGISHESIDSYRIAFGIVPRINAAGRMESAESAVRLLLSGEESDASLLAKQICDDNEERRQIQDELYDSLKKEIEKTFHGEKFIVVNAKRAHEGIAGIVAGKIKEDFNRPVIILTEGEDGKTLKGTGRSVEGVNLFNMIEKYNELFLRYGGHAGACGFTMKADGFHVLKQGLESDAEAIWKSQPELFEKSIKSDDTIEIRDITYDLINQLSMLEPFGKSNEKPVFRLCDVKPEKISRIGAEKNHLRFTVKDEKCVQLTCLFFYAPQEIMDGAETGRRFDIFGFPQINDYMGRKSIQFILTHMVAANSYM